ncbi:Hypothetical protein PBC10988_13620 [Planctomycetales bacterium 10988]|nr:Hypothetical protein PBC10988_13620 [Planctomycetales bacterium 10988]
MPLDPYALCPCGSGKKLKFCCEKLQPEMEKVGRLLEGGQEQAAVRKLESLEAKFPKNAWIATTLATIFIELQQPLQAEPYLQQVLEQYPVHAEALSLASLMFIERGQVGEAIHAIQTVLEHLPDQISETLVDALGLLGSSLFSEGAIIAARGHLLTAMLFKADNQQAARFLNHIHHSPDIPLPLRDSLIWKKAPEGYAESEAFDQAVVLASRGACLAAMKAFQALPAEDAEKLPEYWENIAFCQAFLGQEQPAGESFRRLANILTEQEDNAWLKETSSTKPEMAVRAELLAQLLERTKEEDLKEFLEVTTTPITDWDLVQTHFIADRRSWKIDQPPEQYQENELGIPDQVYWVLDRAKPSVEEVTADTLPRCSAIVEMYAKTTERDALLRVTYLAPDLRETTKAYLQEELGSALGEPQEPKQIPLDTEMQLLRFNEYIPPETPPTTIRELVKTVGRRRILEEWPQLPQWRFEGKTPAEYTQEPGQAIQVLASIKRIEMLNMYDLPAEDFETLRAKLDLPQEGPIDSSELDAVRLPLIWLHRLQPEQLDDETLNKVYLHAQRNDVPSMLKFGREILNRPALAESYGKRRLYQEMLHLRSQRPNEKTFELLAEAREDCTQGREDQAMWDLVEFPMRAMSGQSGPETVEVFRRLTSDYQDLPEIQQRIFQLFMRMGLISPDGQMSGMGPMGGPPAGSPMTESPASPAQPPPASEASPPSSGGLWTPGQSSSGSTSEKPKLWTPGSD